MDLEQPPQVPVLMVLSRVLLGSGGTWRGGALMGALRIVGSVVLKGILWPLSPPSPGLQLKGCGLPVLRAAAPFPEPRLQNSMFIG